MRAALAQAIVSILCVQTDFVVVVYCFCFTTQ